MTSPDIDEHISETEALLAFMESLRDCDHRYKHGALVDWARGPWFSASLMMIEGWQGELAREAHVALKRELEADTPQNRWYKADVSASRDSIVRLLNVQGQPRAAYATAPFRRVHEDGQDWIGGAIGYPFTQKHFDLAPQLDITDVILWNPKTGETRLSGDARGQSCLLKPYILEDRTSVFGDTRAFFIAWAWRRIRTAERREKLKPHAFAETLDGDLPGILVIGDIAKTRWSDVHCAKLHPSVGVRPDAISAAIAASYHLPAVEGA